MDREELRAYLAEGMSLEQIGRAVGRDPSTVGYWVRKHGLQAAHRERHRSRGAVPAETLETLVAQGLTIREIAERVDRSQGTVQHWLRRYGLKTLRRHRRWDPDGERYVQGPCRHHGMTHFVYVESKGGYRCVRCRSEAVIRRRRHVKELLVQEAGGKCQLCGYDRSPGALQFHHRDPTEKSFGVSSGGATVAVDRLRSEASKCALLCANCHAEVEAGLIESP